MKFDLKQKNLSIFSFLVVLISWNFSAYSAPRCSKYFSKEKIPTTFLEEPFSAQPILNTLMRYTPAERNQAGKELLGKPDTLNIDSSSQRIFSESFLLTQNPFIRLYSVIVLSKIRSPKETVDRALLKGLQIYSDTNIQLIVLMVLAKKKVLHLIRPEQILLSDILLSSDDPLIRYYAATALGKVRSHIADADKALIKSLRADPAKDVQLTVLTALGDRRILNLDEVDQSLLKHIFLYNNDPSMRFYAAQALGKVQSPIKAVYRALLEGLVLDTDLSVRARAALSLALSHKNTFDFNKAEQSFLIEIVVSKKEDSLVQFYATMVLKKVKSPTKAAKEVLRDLMPESILTPSAQRKALKEERERETLTYLMETFNAGEWY